MDLVMFVQRFVRLLNVTELIFGMGERFLPQRMGLWLGCLTKSPKVGSSNSKDRSLQASMSKTPYCHLLSHGLNKTPIKSVGLDVC
jgi:hypothetical protein